MSTLISPAAYKMLFRATFSGDHPICPMFNNSPEYVGLFLHTLDLCHAQWSVVGVAVRVWPNEPPDIFLAHPNPTFNHPYKYKPIYTRPLCWGVEAVAHMEENVRLVHVWAESVQSYLKAKVILDQVREG